MAEEKKKLQELIVNTGTVIGSAYSQIARVTVSDAEVTIEFAYVHPSDITKGQSVARITMPRKSAHNLAETIISVEKIYDKRKEGSRND
ncbi:MAG: hypothetical protein ACD_37C00683G0002 [uncultured bacterium]|nr:MAG: hypothetical protein ACD_37C00683G0002 [uncultured bacterium]